MVKDIKHALIIFIIPVFFSCSIRSLAFRAVADGMAPSYAQKERDAVRVQKLKEKGIEVPNPMLAFLGEEDVELVSASFPIIMKLYEMMHLQNKKHKPLSSMTGEFYVMYANAFVETPATFLPDSEYDKKNEEFVRARKLYLKGYHMLLNALELSHFGISDALNSGDEKAIDEVLRTTGIEDVEQLFWAGSASLAAFALEPLNTESEALVYAGQAMLERATEIFPSYNDGAIWEVLTKFYVAAPESLGGGIDKAREAYEKALKFSLGKRPSIYVTYATSFAIPAQDGEAFDEAIEKALSIDAKENPETTLMFTISQNYARWLKAHKEDFILNLND